MIVEDDVWEREGLTDFLDWSSLNIEIVGAASNGVEGLQMAREYSPDIILTDIRMPMMGGLKLANEVQTIIENCKIIVITGHDDFQYAKDAIHIGVHDFLLKPIQKEQLLKTINKTIRILSHERQEEEYINKLKVQISERTFKEKEQILLDILKGNYKDLEAFLNTGASDLSFCLEKTVAMVIEVNGFSYREMDYCHRQAHFSEFYKKVRKLIGNKGLTAISDIEKSEIAICLSVKEDKPKEVKEVIGKIQEQDSGLKKFDFIIGVGSLANSLSDFEESFKHAKIALNSIFFLDEGNILYYHDLVHQEKSKESAACEFLNSAPDYSRRIQNAVVSSDPKEIIALTDKLFNFISNHALDKNLVCDFLANMIHELSVFLLSKDDSHNMYDAGDDLLERFHSSIKLGQLKEWIQEYLIYTNRSFSKNRKNKEEYIIDNVMYYIRNHYKEDIGLDIIAHSLDVSPNYLGSLFKKHAGRRFTQVLTSYRMEKAEELLLSGQDNIKDIAKAVGFRNSSYFCTVFKKIHGISPMEYREKNVYGHGNKE